MRERLFAVNILAGIQRVDGDPFVPVVGGADEHGVELFELEQPPMVGERLRAGGFLQCLVHLDGIHVAQRPHLDLGFLLKEGHYIGPALAGADDAKADAIVRSEDAGIRERRQGAGTRKIAAVEAHG